ncbi:hypothetical protein HN51_061581 [Arachis hypogaea]
MAKLEGFGASGWRQVQTYYQEHVIRRNLQLSEFGFAKMKYARKDAKLNILHKLNNLVALAETLVSVAIIHS